jgi:hypothetical protein
MKRLLLGAVGMLALQALLVFGYLTESQYDPIILDPGNKVLDPDRKPLDETGVAMVVFCGEGRTPQGRGSEVLEKVPPNGERGSWSRRGRTVLDDCDVWYHHQVQNGPAGRD